MPWLITAVCTLAMFGDYFFDINLIHEGATVIQTWTIIISFFTLLIGAVILLLFHTGRILKRMKGQWYFSAVVIGAFAIEAAFGLVGVVSKDTTYANIYVNYGAPIEAALYSLLAFYVAVAAYRVFRAKNIDATLLLGAGLLVMFGSAPFGIMIWPAAREVAAWILTVPNAAVQRAVLIASVIGLVAMGVRVLLGREKGLGFRV